MKGYGAALGALALFIAAAAAVFLWQPGLDSLHDDSVSYLIMAQAFSPWQAADAVIRAAVAHEPYPPLFPLLLALTGGAYDWRIAHLVVALCMGASVYLLGRHAYAVTQSSALAFVAALVYAALPGTWLNAKGILSEFPYMVLVFATLIWHARLGERGVTRRGALVLGGLLAAVMLTRNVGAALLVAIAGAELHRAITQRDASRLKALAPAAVLAIVPVAAWLALRPFTGEDAYVASGNAMLQGAHADAVLWLLASLRANAAALAAAWLNALLIFWGDPSRPGYILAAVLGVFGLAATLVRAARGHADGLYCVVVLAILLFWPWPGQMYRLVFPLLPLVVVSAIWAARELVVAQRFPPTLAERGAVAAALLPLAVCVPAVVFYLFERARMPAPESEPLSYRKTHIAEFYRIPSGPDAEGYAYREIGVFGDMERIRTSTPAGARVMWYTPNYVSLLARRQGVSLTRPENPAEMAAQVRATDADFIYLANVHPRDPLFRQGNPLYPWLLARAFTEVVWYRGKSAADIDAGLLKVDKEKLMSLLPSPAR